MIERVVDYDMLGKPITAKMACWPESWWYMTDEEAEAARIDGYCSKLFHGGKAELTQEQADAYRERISDALEDRG